MARRNRVARAAARAATQDEVVPERTVTAAPTDPAATAVALAEEWAPTIARIALGLVLLYFGVNELIRPSLWTGYVPAIPSTSSFAVGLVVAHGWLLSVLGVALGLGVATRVAAGLSALMLLEIVLSLTFTGGVSDIVARDLGVFGLALAVMGSSRQRLTLSA